MCHTENVRPWNTTVRLKTLTNRIFEFDGLWCPEIKGLDVLGCGAFFDKGLVNPKLGK